MRDRFTRVLKGHIALAMARFPAGTTGSQLDALARHALWQAGLDYDHGTGHGVGGYLSVHEGPQRISKIGQQRRRCEPGMIVSNEPGYYKTGAYGIRIENLVAVAPRPRSTAPTAATRVRDADPGADRPGAASNPACSTDAETAVAQRLSPPRARDGGAGGRRGDAAVARRGDTRHLGPINSSSAALVVQDSSAKHDVFIDVE